jgi:parallel beta-helix repeat protein
VQGNQNGNGVNLTNRSRVTIENTTIEYFQVGIFLDSSSSNNVSMNNATKNISSGIYLWQSSNNIVNGDNTTGNDRYGIYLDVSSGNNITGNSVTANTNDGIYLSSSSSNNVTGNSVTATNDGIYLSSSSNNNNVTGNSVTATNDSIYLSSSSSNNIIWNNVTANTNGGIHLDSSSYNVISGNDATVNTYGIYLSSFSDHNTIRGNKLTKNGYGILLNSSPINTVNMNDATENTYGICLNHSSNNIVNNNSATTNTYGICLDSYSSGNTVNMNNVTTNKCGISLISSQSNTMYYNNFNYNILVQANVTSGFHNVWDVGYPSGGNYWSNYTGGDLMSGLYQNVSGRDGIDDKAYDIDASNKDRYPLYRPYPKPLDVSIWPSDDVVMDVGQVQMFTSTVSGGTSLTYQWYLNGGNVSDAINDTWNFTPTSSGYNTVFLEVTDAVKHVTTTSYTVPVSVYATLSTNISSVRQTIDVGQPLLFSSTVSNGTGTGTYSYQWYLNGTPVPGATNDTWRFTPFTPFYVGSHTVYLNVTDSARANAISNTVQVTVNPALSVNVTFTGSATMDVNQSKRFTAEVSGGTGGPSKRQYEWYRNGTIDPSAIDYHWTFTPTSPGFYSIEVHVTDGANNTVKSNATITVNRLPSVHITPDFNVTMDVGHFLLFNSSVDDGVWPYSYQWYLDSAPQKNANSGSWNFTSVSAGVYKLYLNVTDSVGMPETSNTVNVTVILGLVHNVSVTNVTTSKTGSWPMMTTAAQGIVCAQPHYFGNPFAINNLNITVTAKDSGTSAETFNVTIYANTKCIGWQVITLENDSLKDATFAWNTSGFAYDNYTIRASAEPVLGENDTADNNFTAGVVQVTIPGDISGDGKVNIHDLVLLAWNSKTSASPFNSKTGDLNFYPNDDINNDGVIGLTDNVYLAWNWGALAG